MDNTKQKKWLKAEELIEIYANLFEASEELHIDTFKVVATLYATGQICKEDFFTLLDYFKN